MSHSLKIQLPHTSYPILFDSHNDQNEPYIHQILKRFPNHSNYLIVVDSKVFNFHKDILFDNEFIKKKSKTIFKLTISEEKKNINTLIKIIQFLEQHEADRHTMLIAIGGGVLLDIAAFCASIYVRGIPLVLVPTTLLSQVDASIGGKTGINYQHIKNRIGTFYHPKAIYISDHFLHTLPKKEIRSGLAEVIKSAIIGSTQLFNFLESHSNDILNLEPRAIQRCVIESIKIKKEIVEQDEKEGNIRMHLNLGHTIGHAIEGLAGFGKLTHGEAVAMGIIKAAEFSFNLNHCTENEWQRINQLINIYGYKIAIPSKIRLKRFIQKDKKREGNSISFIVIKKIGHVAIHKTDINYLFMHL